MNLFLLSLGWFLLGAALMVAVRIAMRRRLIQRDAIHATLNVAAIVAMLFGFFGATLAMVGWLAWLVVPIAVLMILIALHQYRLAERRALASLMTLAAETGTPLDLAAESLAAERTGELGYRAARLADLLRKGIPLEYAARKTRLRLPHEEHLALMIGAVTGNISGAVETIARRDDEVTDLFTAVLNRVLYFLVVLAIGYLVMSFIMLKIVPEFEKMFGEFDLFLPWGVGFLMTISRFFVQYGGVISGLILPPLQLFIIVALLYRVGAIRQDLPFLFFLRRRWHTARILRGLAHGCRQGLALPTVLGYLYRYDVEQSVARRLSRAITAIESGTPWTTALKKQGLLSWADVTVLDAAQRAGNLPWAMEELAASNLRRLAHAIRVRMMIVTPIAYGGFAFLIGFVVVALFLPLVRLIEVMTIQS